MDFEDSAGSSAGRWSFRSQDAAATYLEQHYRGEIERVVKELGKLLPAYREQLGGRTYDLAQANLSALASCYGRNVLNVPALEVLLEHLLTLSHMFTCKLIPDRNLDAAGPSQKGL